MKSRVGFLLISAFLVCNGCFVSSAGIVRGESRHRRTPEPVQPSHQPAAPEQFNYRPYAQAPDAIKQLLQFQQAREPLVHIAPQPVPRLEGPKTQPLPSQAQHEAQYQVNQYKPQVQYARQPQYQDPNQIYRQSQNQQQQHQQSAAAYRPAQYNQPQVPRPQYVKSLPPLLQQQLFNGQTQHGQSSSSPIAGHYQ